MALRGGLAAMAILIGVTCAIGGSSGAPGLSGGQAAREPLWIDTGGRLRPAAADALDLLAEASADGLDPADYGASSLRRQAGTLAGTRGADPREAARFDAALTTAVLRYLRELHGGRIDPRAVGFQLDPPADPSDLDARLRVAVTGRRLFELAAALRPTLVQYERLRAALSRDRSADQDAGGSRRLPARQRRQIELALERLRWLPPLGSQRLIVVNVPMFELWAWDAVPSAGRPALGMKVIVGRAARTRTPIFAAQLREVIFRPYWNVPTSILRNELLPALARDPDYFRTQHLEIVQGPGDDAGVVELSAEAIDGLRRGVLRVRQPPGPHNALGLIKFVFPNANDVYMHGTPARALFARQRRDFSHGCIRVEDPIALAAWVLDELPAWHRERIVAATVASSTASVTLPRPIQVLIFYTTAAVMPGEDAVRFADDIYGHDARLDRALTAAAVRSR